MTTDKESSYFGKDAVSCPKCGDYWVHMGIPEFHDGHDSYDATEVSELAGRGNLVRIPFECELCESSIDAAVNYEDERYQFYKCFAFHKGQVRYWTEETNGQRILR